MPVFTDSENNFRVVDEGDYILTVFEFSTGLSSGQKTSGSEKFEVTYLIGDTGAHLKENLIDHESCLWKIDAFLKACGIRNLKKGQAFHFEKDTAERLGVPWINPMGLRCSAQIGHEKYISQRSGKEVTKNVIVAYHTDAPVIKPDPELRQKPTANAAKKEADNKTPF